MVLKPRDIEPLQVEARSLSGIDQLRLFHIRALMTPFYMKIRLILTYVSALVGFLCKISSQPFIFCMEYAKKTSVPTHVTKRSCSNGACEVHRVGFRNRSYATWNYFATIREI